MKFLLLLLLCLFNLGLASESEFTSQTIDIGIICSDLEKSTDFYTHVIGMEIKSTFDVDADFAKRSGLSNGVPFHVKVLKLGSASTATQWKLMQFGDRPQKQENTFIFNHSGVQYITINVTNLTPFIERIKNSKVEFLGKTPVQLDAERYFILVKDPDGTFIELIGPIHQP